MPADAPRRFSTTRWTLVLTAADAASPDARAALASLCETYWFPVYAFIRRAGRPVEDAQDLTQAFFARVIEKHGFKDARPERGRFRSFLLASVKNFLANDADWRHAAKRGGFAVHLPIEFEQADETYRLHPVEHHTPHDVFERRWALAALDAAMRHLAGELAASGRAEHFERLKPWLAGDPGGSYADLAGATGMSEPALRTAVSRLRKEFGASLRAVIAETVSDPADVDDELRHLVEVLRR